MAEEFRGEEDARHISWHVTEFEKEVLESKKKMSTAEFISDLNAKGIGVIFNQASIGERHFIQLSRHGDAMLKLGNVFKWSTIKNRLTRTRSRKNSRLPDGSFAKAGDKC